MIYLLYNANKAATAATMEDATKAAEPEVVDEGVVVCEAVVGALVGP